MSRGNPDRPIESLPDDRLSISPYVTGISQFIRECDTPMTIALQGSWGSGKTSLMKMVLDNLKDSALCVEFNTWQYSQFDLGDRLPVIFYEGLIEKLALEGREPEQNGEAEKLADLCKRAARTAIALGAGFAGVENPLGILKEGMSKESKEVSVVKTVEDLCSGFQSLVEKRCAEGKDRVVFFVDDLDRLPPERAVELMEVMKIVVECKRCVFVLAIDYDVVLRGVRDKYGADFADRKGRSFFDKLIQVPVTIPVSQYKINGYIRELLDGVCGDETRERNSGIRLFATEEELNYAVEFVSLTVGHNPRSIKRLFNLYTLSLCMLSGSGREASLLARQLLFAVQCLRMGYESVYEYFRRIVTDSDDLHTFFDWFKGEDETALNTALAGDPALAQQLGLEQYSAREQSDLRRFVQLLRKFTGCASTLKVLKKRDLFRPGIDWMNEVDAGSNLGISLAEWEDLQEAAELSAATSLGLRTGERSDQIPDGFRYVFLDSFLMRLAQLMENAPALSVTEKCYEARRFTVAAMAQTGRYFKESAVQAMYARDLGWGGEENLVHGILPGAGRDPEGFVERLWGKIWFSPETGRLSDLQDEAGCRASLIERFKSLADGPKETG